ncbi:conjugal transfer protein TraC, partial [Candidatus Kaiserbacteria bacterium]|nr:conjugal transfer protein TraC [Candidatus Kaiserbacteria bacterium]
MSLADLLQPKKNQGEDPSNVIKDQLLTLTDVIAPSAINVSPRSINVSGVNARVYYAVSYPRYLNDGWLEPVLNLAKELDVSIFIHPVDTAETLKKFQKKVAEVQSQINIKAEKGEVRDPQLEAAYRNLEDLRDKLQQAEEKLFDVGFYLTIYGETDTEINQVENDIRGILDARLVAMKPALFQQEPGFKSILPLSNDELMVHSKFNSEPLSSFFPFTSFDLTSDSGILYGVNRHNSSLVLFDRYSLTNYNSVTFATSGAGKSFGLKLEILRSLMFGTEVIVIDPEREYEYLAEATGGRFFNISLSSNHHINPFDLPTPSADEDPRDVLRTHIIELVGLFRLMLGGLTAEEETLIDIAIQETYALKDITGDANFSNLEPPLLTDFEMVLAGMDGSSSLITRLQKYTAGTWSGFMNHATNVDINQKFVVFSLRDMEDELKTIAMYIITNFIWGSIRRRMVKRLMVIDEAWW